MGAEGAREGAWFVGYGMFIVCACKIGNSRGKVIPHGNTNDLFVHSGTDLEIRIREREGYDSANLVKGESHEFTAVMASTYSFSMCGLFSSGGRNETVTMTFFIRI